MIILFQNILFLKEVLACNGCFGLFTKIKKGSKTSLWCTFCAWFSNKNFPYWILYQWTQFRCHNLFPSQDTKQNVLLSSYLETVDEIASFEIYLRSTSKAIAEREKKRGRGKDKNEYLENEKSFLDEIKSIFHSFWRAIIWWKNKNLMKIADTSFKEEKNVNGLYFLFILFCSY